MIHYRTIDSPIGPLALASNGREVAAQSAGAQKSCRTIAEAWAQHKSD